MHAETINTWAARGPSTIKVPRVKAPDSKLIAQRKRRALAKSLDSTYAGNFNVPLPTQADRGKTARIKGRG